MRTSIALASAFTALTTTAFPISLPISIHPFDPLSILSLIPRQIPAPPPGSCDLSAVQQPVSSLPPPNTGLTLQLVAVGRGTQNYTCADSTANTIPTAIGANATLFNASCIASKMPDDILATMTAQFETMDVSAIPLDNIGQHFFVDNTTPTFVINGMGTNEMKKTNTSSAPANTNGNVAWLKLDAPASEVGNSIKEIYRLNTQGGSQPANCSGMPPSFQVQYAADYFFYS